MLPGLGAIALAGPVVGVSGCGCGSKATVVAKPPPVAVDKSGKPKRVWNDNCPEPEDWGREPAPPQSPATSPCWPRRKSSVDGDGGTSGGRKSDEAHPTRRRGRLETHDFYSAKRDNDPRLAAAVAYLGRRAEAKQAAAELLTGLLESPADSRTRRAGRIAHRRRILNSPKSSLPPAANGTPAAQRLWNASWPKP